MVCLGDEKLFWWSDIGPGDDGPLTWDALSFAKAENSPDKSISMVKRQGDLWIFGPRSYEVWRINSSADLPFAYAAGSATEIGCDAARSPAQISDNIFWLGSSTAGKNQVYMSNGYNAKAISTHSIDYQISKIDNLTNDAVGFAYQQEGHTFYVLNFIQGDKTFVFDATNGTWHERSTRDAELDVNHRWSPIYSVFALGKVFVGNSAGSQILELDLDKYEEYNGIPIVRFKQSLVLVDGQKYTRYKSFQLDMETGVGIQATSAQGHDPQAMLQWSSDGGHTWSSEKWRSIGKIGDYKARVLWRNLGLARERVFRITISDPVKVVLIGAELELEKATR
jgi:hypothetical protein